jgi:hypothetical protein
MQFTSEIEISNLIIHSVGNKLKGDTVLLSDSTVILNSELEEVLLKFMISPFKSNEFYNFDISNDNNVVYKSIKTIFDMPSVFVTESKRMAKHLYEETKNPKAFGGNLFVVYFNGCIVDNNLVDAIGLFKSEIADTYLKIKPSNERFAIEREAGINISKLTKGCIVYNYDGDEGYVVEIIDKHSKSEEILYWSDNFLNIIPRQDTYFQTKNAINCVEHFVSNGLPEKFDISKADQINLLNKSLEYFRGNDVFDWNEFADEVFEAQEIIEELDACKDAFEQDNDVELDASFEINVPAVKKQTKVFKSVIKLDDKFDIIIHRDKENLIRGKDDATGLNYYQLLFKNEE